MADWKTPWWRHPWFWGGVIGGFIISRIIWSIVQGG